MERLTIILSFDGGGMRGILPCVWLARLEELLGAPACNYCDYVAGTSTGSIIACAVAARIPSKELLELYRTQGRKIFPGAFKRRWSRFLRTCRQGLSAPKYSADGLRSALQERFGDQLLGDVPKHLRVLVPTYDTVARRAYVLKSTESPGRELPMWEAALASSAAPTYFPAHVTHIDDKEVALLDGGVVANNPGLCAVSEALHSATCQAHPGLSMRLVVGSFGTGDSTRSISARKARTWGALQWAAPISDVFLDGAADAIHYQTRWILGRERYIRMQARLISANDDMDDASASNIQALIDLAHRWIDEGGEAMLEELAGLMRSSCRTSNTTGRA